MASIQETLNQLMATGIGAALAYDAAYKKTPEGKVKAMADDIKARQLAEEMVKAEGETQEVSTIPAEGTYTSKNIWGAPLSSQKKAGKKQYDVATENALDSITRKTDTQREMVASLATRFDELSAKQKHQVLDVAHKLNKKGGNT